MAWRGLHLTQAATLSLADGQIHIRQEAGEVRLALEDIAWVIIDTSQATFTSALMSACMTAGVALVFTDARHTPCGVTLPFHQHHRQAAVAKLQTSVAEGLKKRLWQAIVRRKIGNQAAVLAQINAEDAATLIQIARHVEPGDPQNVEARAARFYWQRLFSDFIRDDEADLRNKMLNYGYAVIRAGVARALVASGFLPSFGLKHDSATNAFNLADDLVEPFRPFVDLLVRNASADVGEREAELTSEHRRMLAGALFSNCQVEERTNDKAVQSSCATAGKRMPRGVRSLSIYAANVSLLVATEKAADSLIRALEAGKPNFLALPVLEHTR